MNDEYERTEVLITVKTYPHPSEGYKELVCIAGITASGEWVRLYPVDFRYMPEQQQFKKYQWIDVALEPHGRGRDKRKESRKPKLNTIRILREQLSTEDKWRERRRIIDPLPHNTLRELEDLYDREKVSLGIIRPKRVIDVEVAPTDEPDWKPKWKNLRSQKWLFGEQPKRLRKLPFQFRYVFECEDSDAPHRCMIVDWELGALFLKESDRLGSDSAAAEAVRRKYLDEICAPDKDTRFFMGTRFPYNTWLVIGVFWPPRVDAEQGDLFE